MVALAYPHAPTTEQCREEAGRIATNVAPSSAGQAWRPGRSTIAAAALTGFVAPYLGPVVVRYCPDEARHAFPFVFAKDFLGTADATLAVGLAMNAALVAAGLLAIASGLKILGRSSATAGAVLDRLRNVKRALTPVLVAAAVIVVILGLNRPDWTADVGPGHVDTPACAHVAGHTIVNNWWGQERFSLLDLKRIGLS